MTAETEIPQAEITQTAPSAGSCCGGGSCGSAGSADEVEVGSVTAVYEVTGMTCGHCEGAVSGEISEIPGVGAVTAVASTGRVTVVSKAPLDEETVRAAVDEAGYVLVGRV
ncbi:heavy-metal-associated domain-containing protein [Streptomyces beijiangensis]|uniref:Heavy-metal-associated domain-containing protein n=1 Tax=Streptomyces beijiangensis TaxID=163361 RepID=A0A939JKU4_9ACTN|nr:heavy metal-associated domain-containing protein [Streptomyces beijiangensis]MBO0515675.1 heavy-metal-associated domain-containing protein [Streptomyces beijiangensis]